MKFEEIFNGEGMYVADGFAEGFAIKIDSFGFMRGIHYKSKDDILPEVKNAHMYK